MVWRLQRVHLDCQRDKFKEDRAFARSESRGIALNQQSMTSPISGNLSDRARLAVSLATYVLALGVLIIGMNNIRWFDPSRIEGQLIATAMIVSSVGPGLGVLLLGFVRRHRSRFKLKTLLIVTAAIAVYLGLCRAINPVIPTILIAGELSIMMLYEAQRTGGDRWRFAAHSVGPSWPWEHWFSSPMAFVFWASCCCSSSV